MFPIRKKDTVILTDSSIAKVVDIITTEVAKVYKVEKFADKQIMYVEEKRVRLNKQYKLNYIITFTCELINFFCYTFNR